MPGTLLEQGLQTKSGKFELYAQAIAPYSNLEPLPAYVPPKKDGAEYPLLLSSSPRITGALHSRLHRVAWNRSLRREPLAELSPEDGAALGIAEGDSIKLISPRGAVQVKAHLTKKAEPGVVCLYQDYPEADVNLLTDSEQLDPYSGFPSFRETNIRIERV